MAASPVLVPQRCEFPAVYRPRNPRSTPLFQLVEAHYENVKALWEDRFENTHGRWRGFTDSVVARYLDCASPECGFATSSVQFSPATNVQFLTGVDRRSCARMAAGKRVDHRRAVNFSSLLGTDKHRELDPARCLETSGIAPDGGAEGGFRWARIRKEEPHPVPPIQWNQ